MTTHTQLRELIPIHALDALEGAERTEMEAHLPTCDLCAAELDVFHELTSRFSGETPMSASLWGSIVTATEREHQPTRITNRDPRWWRFVTLAAAVFALVFGFGVLNGPNDDLPILTAEQLTSNSDAIDVSLDRDGAQVARVVLAPDGQGLVLPNNSLETLDKSHTYQLWVINRYGVAISAGVLGSSPRPASFTWTDDLSGFALTTEVSGGVVSSEGEVVAVVGDL